LIIPSEIYSIKRHILKRLIVILIAIFFILFKGQIHFWFDNYFFVVIVIIPQANSSKFVLFLGIIIILFIVFIPEVAYLQAYIRLNLPLSPLLFVFLFNLLLQCCRRICIHLLIFFQVFTVTIKNRLIVIRLVAYILFVFPVVFFILYRFLYCSLKFFTYFAHIFRPRKEYGFFALFDKIIY